MTPYFVVVKDGKIIDCTSDAATATERFLSQDAFGMYKAESLADISEILNTDWDKELGTNFEAEIGNMWNYLCEGVRKVVDKTRELTTEEKTDEFRAKVAEITEHIRETGRESLEELRAYLKKLKGEEE